MIEYVDGRWRMSEDKRSPNGKLSDTETPDVGGMDLEGGESRLEKLTAIEMAAIEREGEHTDVTPMIPPYE